MLWGTYRSNLYFGTRARTKATILTGLVWYPTSLGSSFTRHTCEIQDELASYGWIMHDGRTFGHEILVDPHSNMHLEARFYKHDGNNDWSVHFKGRKLNQNEGINVKIMYYVACEQSHNITDSSIHGKHPELGEYWVFSSLKNASYKGLDVPSGDLWKVKEFLLVGKNDIPKNSNIALIEENFTDSFEFHISFIHGNNPNRPFRHHDFEIKMLDFERNFFSRFPIYTNCIFDTEAELNGSRNMAMFALSNLLGGISYFYGNSFVGLNSTTTPGSPNYITTQEYSLFTDVPSRPVFPRGFLWDSGFHNLIISHWDLDLSVEIINSWISLIDDNGWIGREQILGDEARSKVPAELLPQNQNYGNPPTFLFPIMKIMSRQSNIDKFFDELLFFYKKLQKNFEWFLNTQRGLPHPSIAFNSNHVFYQWKGRTHNHTLTSGLDDYPRGHHPNSYEIHLDLMCWMAWMSKCLQSIEEKLLIKNENRFDYEIIYDKIIFTLNALCKDTEDGLFYDRSVNEKGEFVFVKHHGYINLFPLLLQILSVESAEFLKIIELLERELISPYGIASLSKYDSYYGLGDNYWTGPIWININFLLLRALYLHYIPASRNNHSLHNRISAMYNLARNGIITNMLKQYILTGHIWEQYNPETGIGQRAHPFTGWSSLILLIMIEEY